MSDLLHCRWHTKRQLAANSCKGLAASAPPTAVMLEESWSYGQRCCAGQRFASFPALGFVPFVRDSESFGTECPCRGRRGPACRGQKERRWANICVIVSIKQVINIFLPTEDTHLSSTACFACSTRVCVGRIAYEFCQRGRARWLAAVVGGPGPAGSTSAAQGK